MILLLSCSLGVDHKEYKSKNYQISGLEGNWKNVDPDISDFAFKHSSGAFLVFNSVCKKYSVPELRALKNSLLYGVSDLKVIKEKKQKLFNRDGLVVHSMGSIDGVKVNIYSKIFNRNHCTHDIVMIAPQTRSLASLTKNFESIEKVIKFND